MSDFAKLARMLSEDAEPEAKIFTLQPEARANDLRLRFDEFSKVEDFKPGDLVMWKDGMKTKSNPLYGEPAIVTIALANPVYDEEQGAGSVYFREPLTLVLGIFEEDGTFTELHVDSRRFRKVDL